MRLLVIGDTHGRQAWKQIVDQPFDKVIFIGDYVDTHEDINPLEQVENLREIIKFKQNNKDKVILLVGNHDYHYWPGIDEHYSGYQPMMRMSFEYEYRKYQHLFQAAYVKNDIVFSHAGLTETWLNDVGINKPSIDSVVKSVNDLFKHKPYKFGFFWGDTSNCGDNIHQGPFWVRPQSLYRDGISNLQAVGHTTVQKINAPKSKRQGFYLIDTLGTSGEYLVVEDEKILINSGKVNVSEEKPLD